MLKLLLSLLIAINIITPVHANYITKAEAVDRQIPEYIDKKVRSSKYARLAHMIELDEGTEESAGGDEDFSLWDKNIQKIKINTLEERNYHLGKPFVYYYEDSDDLAKMIRYPIIHNDKIIATASYSLEYHTVTISEKDSIGSKLQKLNYLNDNEMFVVCESDEEDPRFWIVCKDAYYECDFMSDAIMKRKPLDDEKHFSILASRVSDLLALEFDETNEKGDEGIERQIKDYRLYGKNPNNVLVLVIVVLFAGIIATRINRKKHK